MRGSADFSAQFSCRRWILSFSALLPVILFLPQGLGEDPFKFSSATLEKAESKYGADTRKRLESWQALLASDKKGDDLSKIKLVNDYFNERIMFVSDAQNWGVEDYWATPVEMLVKGRGDCEDFAIAKYFSLQALGVPESKMRITYVQAAGHGPTNLAHMVLTYYPTPAAVPLVLDNLIPEIRPASQRPDLTPVYGFNGQGLWLARDRTSGNAAPRKNNISYWDKLMSRRGRELD